MTRAEPTHGLHVVGRRGRRVAIPSSQSERCRPPPPAPSRKPPMPVAASQRKKAALKFIPPNCSSAEPTTRWSSGAGSTAVSWSGRSRPVVESDRSVDSQQCSSASFLGQPRRRAFSDRCDQELRRRFFPCARLQRRWPLRSPCRWTDASVDRDGVFLDLRTLLVQDHLVFLLAHCGPRLGVGEVRVGDRLALNPNLLTLHRTV